MLFWSMKRVTQLIETGFPAIAEPKFCTISLVGARPYSQSLVIYCTSSCCCVVVRFLSWSCLASRGPVTPRCLRLSVDLSTPHLAAYFVYGNRGPDSCDFKSSIAFSMFAMVVELSRVGVDGKVGVRVLACIG